MPAVSACTPQLRWSVKEGAPSASTASLPPSCSLRSSRSCRNAPLFRQWSRFRPIDFNVRRVGRIFPFLLGGFGGLFWGGVGGFLPGFWEGWGGGGVVVGFYVFVGVVLGFFGGGGWLGTRFFLGGWWVGAVFLWFFGCVGVLVCGVLGWGGWLFLGFWGGGGCGAFAPLLYPTPPSSPFPPLPTLSHPPPAPPPLSNPTGLS